MKTKKQIKDFILKTLLPYKEDRGKLAYSNGGCRYLTEDSRKCALGRWMKKGKWQESSLVAESLACEYKLKYILLKPARDMEFTKNQWGLIQRYHDNLALNERVSFEVGQLEEEFDIELRELY